MSRQAGVRQKNGYWYSAAGGKGQYFGAVGKVSKNQAMADLHSFLAGLDSESKEAESMRVEPLRKSQPVQPRTLTVTDLTTLFLAWLMKHRDDRTVKERTRHLARFGKSSGKLLATTIGTHHLDDFRDLLLRDGCALEYVRKHEVSVRALFRWSVKHGHVPAGFAPFSACEPTRVPQQPLLESDLPTEKEVQAILFHAKGGMADILTVYHATGARTHELIEAVVGDFQPLNRTIVLGKHKRSKTLRDPVPRTISLNQTAYAILVRCCENRKADEPIFRNRCGYASSRWEIARKFVTVRKHAGVRDAITIYSFRHLWMSEALMAGVDVLLVAKMAGTSVKMIEQTYGHFKTSSFAAAQAKLDAARKI